MSGSLRVPGPRGAGRRVLDGLRAPGRWWAAYGSVARVDLYTRATLYLIQSSQLLSVGLVFGSNQTGPWDGSRWLLVSAGLAVAHTVVCLLVLRAAIGAAVRGGGLPRRPLALAAVVTAVLAVLALAAPVLLPHVQGLDPAVPTVAVLVVGLGLAVSPALSFRALVSAGVGTGAGLALLGAGRGVPSDVAVQISFIAANVFILMGATYQVSIWMLRVVDQLTEAQQTKAQLAVAEERLRFARDLHDVLGSQLAAIAVKSDLAAELARRGLPAAVEQAGEVRQLAHAALREVREVVTGYRRADLLTELAGSASLLRAAGVRCELVADPDASLDTGAQEALAWVVREAATNVLRHSEASRCEIVLRHLADRAVLTVTNDGVRERHAGGVPGNGLAGLRERLAARGGTLTVRDRDQGEFTLAAEVPLGADR